MNETQHRGADRALRRGLLPVAALMAVSCPIYAADSTSLHERVLATYNFSPHSLNSAEIADKSKVLDAFWTEVKAEGTTGLAALREELSKPESSPYFSYDGAKLLLSLSRTHQDEVLALAAITRADLRDLQTTDYFLTVHALSVDGLDTAAAAFKILTDEQFQVFIPQHDLTLNEEDCLSFLLLPTNEGFYIVPAERRLFTEQSIVAQKSLMSLLANTVTKQGDAAIVRFAADPAQPAEARAYANTIMDATQRMAKIPLMGLSLKSYAELKNEQKELMARVSDESLDDWEHLRIKLRHRGPQ